MVVWYLCFSICRSDFELSLTTRGKIRWHKSDFCLQNNIAKLHIHESYQTQGSGGFSSDWLDSVAVPLFTNSNYSETSKLVYDWSVVWVMDCSRKTVYLVKERRILPLVESNICFGNKPRWWRQTFWRPFCLLSSSSKILNPNPKYTILETKYAIWNTKYTIPI